MMPSTATLAPSRAAAARRPLVPLSIVRGQAPTAPRFEHRPDVRRRVVILSATVGQGHEGAARELAHRLEHRGLDVEVHDYLDALPAPARRALRDLYRPTVQYAPRLFETLFQRLEGHGALRAVADRVCRAAEATVAAWADGADAVVTTYPLGGQTLGRLREQGRLVAPAITYLTDPAAHALWCHPAVDEHLTVTRATAADAGRYGIRARTAGPLCGPGFGALDAVSAGATRLLLRERLRVDHDAPVVLLSAGSLGMGSVPRTVRDVLRHPDARVVVLCGRSAALQRRLDRVPRVVALGWRDDVPALMAAADVLIHNAGGLSFTEALVAGLPAITYRPIPGHGRANADVLDRAGIAPWPHTADDLADAISAVGRGGPAGVTDAAGWPAGADPAEAVVDVLRTGVPAGASTI